tara:strand:- start:424 stop:594 length:171 start_codon:yes stop_codon:yes gene_type:complete
MFPYNDEEIAWINKKKTTKTTVFNHSLIYSLLFALVAAILATTIPPIIYFSRINSI